MNTPSHRVPAWLRGARVRLARVAGCRGEPRFHWCWLVDALERGLKAVRVAGDRPSGAAPRSYAIVMWGGTWNRSR